MSQCELQSNSGVISHNCTTVSAHGLFLPPGSHLECCLSPPDTVKCDTLAQCFIYIITCGVGRVKYGLNRTRLFGKRRSGTWSEVRAVPVSVVNVGETLKAALKCFVKGLGSELGRLLPALNLSGCSVESLTLQLIRVNKSRITSLRKFLLAQG